MIPPWPCPTCGAPAAGPCVRTNRAAGSSATLLRPHAERVAFPSALVAARGEIERLRVIERAASDFAADFARPGVAHLTHEQERLLGLLLAVLAVAGGSR